MSAAPLRMPVAAERTDIHDAATALFSALADAEAPDRIQQDRLPTAGETANAQIDVAWPLARVVSFDVFDTLLVRKVANPRDVFLHLATPAPFAEWSLDPQVLARQRQEAEHSARQAGRTARRSGEVTLHEIHAALAQLLGRPLSDVPAMVRAEQMLERALCVAHPHLRTVFDRAVRDGKTIWCVSDTYHDATFLRELLDGCGFAMDGVSVVSSADRRMSKGDGALLKTVAAESNIAHSTVLHIGDHPVADFTLPAKQGILAVLHPWAASRHDDPPSQSPGDAIALGLAQIGSRTVEPAFPFWWRFGYSVAGPMLSAFAYWLHARLVTDGVQRAYFLLRDGEIILDVYRAVIGDQPGPVTTLLESSRRAFVLPGIESGRNALTSQLLACENPRPAREFLERLGVPAADYSRAFRAVGFASLDDIVAPDDMVAMHRVLALFGRQDVMTAVLVRSQSERQLLWRFLEQEGVLAPGRIGLVDIGWSGTIQKALVASAALEKHPLDAIGYYLGTLPPIREDLAPSAAFGFLFDAGHPAENARAVIELRQLVEFICTTTRGSLRGFRADGNRVLPVHATVDHSPAQQQHIGQLRDGALAYARGLSQERRVFGSQVVGQDAALRHLARTIRRPTTEEAEAIGEIRHGEGLGADRLRTFAAFGEAPHTRASLLRDYRNAYWPTGLLARREPAALALRSLLWMQAQ